MILGIQPLPCLLDSGKEKVAIAHREQTARAGRASGCGQGRLRNSLIRLFFILLAGQRKLTLDVGVGQQGAGARSCTRDADICVLIKIRSRLVTNYRALTLNMEIIPDELQSFHSSSLFWRLSYYAFLVVLAYSGNKS